jgi:hypothetical protein
MLKMIPAAAILAAVFPVFAAEPVQATTVRDLDGHVAQVLSGKERAFNGTLRKAERRIVSRLPGTVETVARDDEPSMHYHVDVRLTNGALARLAVAPYTGRISWREPAVVRE